MNNYKEICENLKVKTKLKYLNLDICSQETTIYNTKLGGNPYIPKGFNYPIDKSIEFYGEKLCFLAQINFEEMPKIDFFPEKGILQFYIASNYLGEWGMNSHDKLNVQDSFRVIYHEKIDYFNVQNIYYDDFIEKELPFEGEFLLKPNICYGYINLLDYRFKNLLINELDKYNKKFDENILDEYREGMLDMFSCNSISIGGYPNFIHDDFRYNHIYNDYSIKLLEIPSIINDKINLSWGDNGIANFMISKEYLKNLDFSNICFQWQSY